MKISEEEVRGLVEKRNEENNEKKENEERIIDRINSPEDVKGLSEEEMINLASEIREFLIEKVEKSGGHLASNLGVVELTLALHKVFDSPKDKIIFDVGHQAYVHKIITGRKNDFDTLRTPGGLSGFTLRKESEHDPFGAGHSSTSISAAVGFAEANALSRDNGYVVALLGDGAFTGGMVHEAINNCKKDLKLIIILNENRMSISKNKGTFASYLARVRISQRYVKWKKSTSSFLRHIPILGKPIIFCLSAIKNGLKKSLYSTNYFEDLGFYYIGPVNGNEYKSVEKAMLEAKKLGKCCIIHTYTKKGKGYDIAEKSPDDFHSIRTTVSTDTFHSVVANQLIEIAEKDEKVLAVTAAMGIGTGLSKFGEKYPDRYFDVGIAESHALTFCAGLAAAEYKPYVAIYSTFLQRGYDNILHDIALQNLPVRILIDRASLAVSDGATHHGIFDIAFLMHIPNIELYAPATYGSLRFLMRATLESKNPVAIRYPDSRELDIVNQTFYSNAGYEALGVRANYTIVPELVFVAVGCAVNYALEASKHLITEGINSGVILVEKLKPYKDVSEQIYDKVKGAKRILFVEEGIKCGSFSMIVKEKLLATHTELADSKIGIAAVDDNFASPEQPCDLYDYVGLSAKKIKEKILNL